MTELFPHPIAILSFDRPKLLDRVLQSLRAQSLEPDGYRIALYQDGAIDYETGRRKTDPALIAQCVATFRRWVPGGMVFESPFNLGIAANRTRAERGIFAAGDAGWGFFMEDDLMLGPRYLEVIELLRQQFEDQPMMASLAAYGDHLLPAEEQLREPGAMIVMRHAWGCLERASFWRERRILTDHYDSLIGGIDYRNRPHWVIDALFEDLGYGNFFADDHAASTSQDNLRTLATNLLCGVRYMTRTPYGRYIGETGEHYDAESYAQEGFGTTQVSAEVPESFVAVPEPVQRHNVLSYLNWNGRYMRREHSHWLPLNGRAAPTDAAALSRRDTSPTGMQGRLASSEAGAGLLNRLNAPAPLSRFKEMMFRKAVRHCGGTLVIDVRGRADAMDVLSASPELLLLDNHRFLRLFEGAPVSLLVINDILTQMAPELRDVALRNLASGLAGSVRILALHLPDPLVCGMQRLIAQLVRDMPVSIVTVQADVFLQDRSPGLKAIRSRFPAIDRLCHPQDLGWHVFLYPAADALPTPGARP